MKPNPVQPKVEATTVLATNGTPTKTTNNSAIDQDIKEVTPKSRINSIWNFAWDILSKAATAIVIVWGGQGIYDRNFNQKEDFEIKQLQEENKKLQERIIKLEEKVKQKEAK